jgi:hypothetical protein
MGNVRDWEDKNKDLIYGEAACKALEREDTIIKELEAKLAALAETLAQKDALIKNLEAKLEACQGAQPQQSSKEVPGSSESDMKDELVRKTMRIKQLEKSNNLLKQANIQEIAKFSAAGKARKIGSDNEAAVRKANVELPSELATARSQL